MTGCRNSRSGRSILLGGRAWFLIALAVLVSWGSSRAVTPGADFKEILEMWKRKEYLNVVQSLKEYRQGPYGKTPEVDYMIASSMCRLPGYESKGQQYFQWLLYNHRLDARSRTQVLEEMRNCASTQAPIVINFVIVRSGAGARVGGKMFYSVGPDLPVSSVPVKVLREIPETEMAKRLAPLSDPGRGIRAVSDLLGPGSVVEPHGHFLLARKDDLASGTARPGSLSEKLRSPAALANFGGLLEQYLGFFTREFKMEAPTNFITVYCLADSESVRKVAELLHGIRVSELSIGYSYRDDLSLTGLFDGTLLHELFHLLVYRNFGDIPPWLDEGIAALYEVSQARGGRIEGLPNWRGDVLREFRGSRPSVEDLVRMDWRGFDDETGEYRSQRQAMNHAMARYLMLMFQERNQLAPIYHAFRNRQVEILQGDPAAEAVRLVETVTSKPIAALDTDFGEWLERTLEVRPRDGIARETSANSPNINPANVNSANVNPAILNLPALPPNSHGDLGPDPKRAKTISPSDDEIRQGVRVRASREEKIIDTLKNGRPRRLYSAWIDAPDPILQKIVKVRYRYDPAKFDPPTREQTTRNNGFMDTYLGIGAVDADMDIDLVLNDGRTVTLKFNMYRTLFGN